MKGNSITIFSHVQYYSYSYSIVLLFANKEFIQYYNRYIIFILIGLNYILFMTIILIF